MPLLHVSWLWGNHGKCMEMSKCPVSSSFLILRRNMLLPSCGVPLRSLRNFQPPVLCARCVACMWTSWTLLRKKWLTVQQDDRWSHDSSGVCLVSTTFPEGVWSKKCFSQTLGRNPTSSYHSWHQLLLQ